MSGHSKWHNIQAKKGKTDAARGKVFTKLGKEIVVAVKNGGASTDTNAKLRDVIAKAKAANMPNDTIAKAIKKASGELSSVNYENIVYEGYGPSGVAVIVETLTDNKNRSAGNVRSAFTKGGGNMGTSGCVAFMFQEKGELIIEKGDRDEEEMMMLALDAGAEDFSADEEEVFVVTTLPEDFGTVREALEAEGIEFLEAAVKMIPDTYTAINEDEAKKFQKMLNLLDEDDDVQEVYHNAEFPEGWDE
ncbi:MULTISPECIES: YebC/PmpR family DNA-binding transcriptional regulator [Clostridium]|jgi:YebC/PmpR family DNA-binding regulatory protein|uniref:Probable transcriptional regulatory protein Cspa_c44680 n=1 Tax=Clostridium saccharoperbutylacetonicum N1-4(HMT) TaxID=931276 RepID=M1MU67_9CLOT|nr:MULTISPECIES: YebC/PmpR family DNA-binding transcriptional regulator [Clostridium]AGF58221.1 DNA-binding regulatory protein, YebC/PmpR family [Clostridium saccharoperbutylacetonicum N1-4(HMT)]AQR96906.1 putative transcriptional regulatory protein [Clostridium saccharoperbutylacetonicum]NRT61002.1 YebC/PmpR family DNA-binding regulatory protein [Clostridium saccharoperbutylacetonicum]NSB24317.1 YebC/PmpR family DNA-binding regulatory protein [Clostridium saccharoperbutylacetonicum]NSB32785.1